jgi:tRNA(adenine34) deaminase
MIYPVNHLQPLNGNEPIADDLQGMRLALAYAERASQADEVPVGAVLTFNQEIVGFGWNCPIGNADPTAHAEIQALRLAAQQLGNYRLNHTTLYVTLEPCAMCVGALIHARVSRVVFGAFDYKAGAVKSHLQLFEQKCFNHRIEWTGGVLLEECQSLLQTFFEKRRR